MGHDEALRREVRELRETLEALSARLEALQVCAEEIWGAGFRYGQSVPRLRLVAAGEGDRAGGWSPSRTASRPGGQGCTA